LPGFWKIAKACMDGKYLQRDAAAGGQIRASSRPPSACRQMASDIVKFYIGTMSQFFTLSDIAVVSSSKPTSSAVPSFVPVGTTVFAAAHFAELMSAEVNDCAQELMAMDIGKELTQATKGMTDSLRWRMLEVVSSTWLRGEYQSPHLTWASR
jgi:exocyst complex component 2